jgi:hypothetical protein
VLARDLDRGLGLAGEAEDDLGLTQQLRQQELDGDLRVELLVMRRDDEGHPSAPENTLDPELAVDDDAGADRRVWLGIHGAGAKRLYTGESLLPKAWPVHRRAVVLAFLAGGPDG